MRGISQIFGTLLMILVVLVAVTEVILVGYPLLTKRMEVLGVNTLEKNLEELSSMLINLANSGGDIVYEISLPAYLERGEASIGKDPTGDYGIFIQFTTNRPYYSSELMPLDDSLAVISSGEKVIGRVPYNKPIVVVGKTESFRGLFRNTLGLLTRPVVYPSTGRIVRIVLKPAGDLATSCNLPCKLIARKTNEMLVGDSRIVTLEVGFQ